MPATYDPIATVTLGSAIASITFSSISAGYTDLRLVLYSQTTAANGSLYLRFNGDSGSNYSYTQLKGNGLSISSAVVTSNSEIYWNGDFGASNTQPVLVTADIFSYTGSTNKNALMTASMDANGSGITQAVVGMWRNTSAINTVTAHINTGNFGIGTVATLYGILKA